MSNDTKHTPGPWLVSNTDRWKIIDAKGIKLCDCYFSNDASIVAAAPDMLEALKGIIEKYGPKHLEHKNNKVWRDAYSAIAKAEGKQ